MFHLGLRWKTILYSVVTLLLLIATIYISMFNIIEKNTEELERRDVHSNLARCSNALQGTYDAMAAVASDWGWWDDTYQYVQEPNAAYKKVNLVDATFINLSINVMAIYNANGEKIYGGGYDYQNAAAMNFPAALDNNPQFMQLLFASINDRERHSGLIMLPEGPMMIAYVPILQSDTSGTPAGVFLIGRFLNRAVIKDFAAITRLDLSITSIDDPAISSQPDLLHRLRTGSDSVIEPIDNSWIAGYSIIDDVYGQPAMLMRVQLARDIHLQARGMIGYLSLAIVAAGLLFGLLILLFQEKVILSRLYRLDQDVAEIGAAEDFSARVEAGGQDELAHLAGSVNQMLGELEDNHQRLKDHDASLRRITDNMTDVVSQVDRQGILEYCSPSHVRVLGYNVEDMLGTPAMDYCHPGYCTVFASAMEETCCTGQPTSVQIQAKHIDGTYLWMEMMFNPVFDHVGQVNGVVLVGRDITARKKAEDTILYISLHDALTGLYNRTYFEQQMLLLEGPEHVPVALFICDLDGLKFINDTLGHQTGDAVLTAAARVLSHCFPEHAVIARIGGDEYAILIRHCNRLMVENYYRSIKQGVSDHNQQYPERPMAISVGFSIRYDVKLSMADLFSEADNNMYREKLHSQQSGHSGLVATLMQALKERDFITSGHVERMDRLITLIGEALNLSRNRIHDLQLLARFHDIGKVGIPDSILCKPGPLSIEEFAEMQTHTEIGYRIARTAIDLQPVAEWILKHHEWWNGKGYPLKLKGDEIPLECRILAIVDAYDAMVSDRPYRKAMTSEDAIKELQNCAGTQFDPDLVEIFVNLLTSGVIGA